MNQSAANRDPSAPLKLKGVLAYDYHPKSDRLVVSLTDQTSVMYNLTYRDSFYSLNLNFKAHEVKIAPDGSRVLFMDK